MAWMARIWATIGSDTATPPAVRHGQFIALFGGQVQRFLAVGAGVRRRAATAPGGKKAEVAGLREWLMSLGEHRPRFLRENPVFEPGFYGGGSEPRWEGNPVLKSGGFW